MGSIKKKQLGQFNTTDAARILQGFEPFVVGKTVLDPFAGQQDLLRWAQQNGADSTSGFDIDPVLLNDSVKFNDSLLSIPNSEFCLTNPPYLNKSKLSNDLKLKYNFNNLDDLYHLAIKRILESNSAEGIVIVPVNFLCGEGSEPIRVEFLSKYRIDYLKYFTFQVFNDTTYNVIAFKFTRAPQDKQTLNFLIYNTFDNNPKKIQITIDAKYNFKIGGEELHKINSLPIPKIKRLTENFIKQNPGEFSIKSFCYDKNKEKIFNINEKLSQNIKSNIILLNCIDSSTKRSGWLRAESIKNYTVDCLVTKNTSRNQAFCLLPWNDSIDFQNKTIDLFNKTITDLRSRYYSLFLSNFRDNGRKRISFDFCYRLIAWCRAELIREGHLTR